MPISIDVWWQGHRRHLYAADIVQKAAHTAREKPPPPQDNKHRYEKRLPAVALLPARADVQAPTF
jgi:hypothetical protein